MDSEWRGWGQALLCRFGVDGSPNGVAVFKDECVFRTPTLRNDGNAGCAWEAWQPCTITLPMYRAATLSATGTL